VFSTTNFHQFHSAFEAPAHNSPKNIPPRVSIDDFLRQQLREYRRHPLNRDRCARDSIAAWVIASSSTELALGPPIATAAAGAAEWRLSMVGKPTGWIYESGRADSLMVPSLTSAKPFSRYLPRATYPYFFWMPG